MPYDQSLTSLAGMLFHSKLLSSIKTWIKRRKTERASERENKIDGEQQVWKRVVMSTVALFVSLYLGAALLLRSTKVT